MRLLVDQKTALFSTFCPTSVRSSQAWHHTHFLVFDDLDQTNHTFSESLSLSLCLSGWGNVGNARKKTYFYGRTFISFGGQYQPSTKLAILQTGLLSIQCIKDTSWIEELGLCSWDKLASFPLLAHLSRWLLRSQDRVVASGVEPLGNCKGQDNR